MIEVYRGIKFEEGIQITCDTIKDFNNFCESRLNVNRNLRLYIKEIDEILIKVDEYNTGLFEWGVLCLDDRYVPLRWTSLEKYKK